IAGEVPTTPGLLSRNGWHLIDDSGKEIIKDGWIKERPVNHYRDLYFFAYGEDYKAALQALTTISGDVPMTRKYVHGSWYCRWWDYTEKEYRKIVQEYKEHNFPLDILVMDMGWHRQKDATTGMGHAGQYGWTGYSWNKELIPEPEKLIRDLKADNIYVTLNDHPHDGIRHTEDHYSEFMKSMRVDPNEQKDLLFDAGNQEYMKNFFEYAHGPNEKIGIDFWWLDWQQDYVMPHVIGYKNLRHLPWLNNLYFQNSSKGNKRPLIFSRWAGWGSHRTPIQFSGDAIANWEMLKFEIPFTATSGNAGCFFWAHDIGGFSGGKDPELYVRWTQFALTNSSLRIHSVYDSELDRRPWRWGKQAEDALKIIYHLRSKLMPYIYSSVYQCHNESLPLNRCMYIEHPKEEEAYQNPQQFMFGDLLLSAPIVSPGTGTNHMASQKVWFPAGNIWYNLFNNKAYEGGQTVNATADINEFPLFVKGGYPLVMQPYRERMASAKLDTLVIRCFPGKTGCIGTYTLYEDDGLSDDYKKGKQVFTKLDYLQKDSGARLTIYKASGAGYAGQPTKRAYRIELPIKDISKAILNKRSLKMIKESAGTVVLIPSTDITKDLIINIKYQ
ncbi:MAG: glycoside hydrolase family 31 protein, partial [Bacteroidota bacterium]|nr:glycoside hydrolase family 31 protein [Bacteroidota bacterium]